MIQDMKKAVFLDRDGVLTELLLNPATGEYEPPHQEDGVALMPFTIESLARLQEAGYLLFTVSNQPDYAKGKNTLEAIKGVNARFEHEMASQGIKFEGYYYCYHHPNGINADYSFECECRKPKPFFLLKAAKEYSLSMKNSWMVGDRDTDVQTGAAAGTKTLLVENPKSAKYQGKAAPTCRAADIKDAVDRILTTSEMV